MEMRTGEAGLHIIKSFEGCRLTAYKCPAGVWTIGYGHTLGVKEGQRITQAQADGLLVEDIRKYEKKVNKYYDRYAWRQNEFDALVSFAFNVGSIDQLSANGTRSKKAIGEKIILYNKAGGKELAGLTKRRKEEQKLFLASASGGNTAQNKIPASSDKKRPVLKKGSVGAAVKELQQRLNGKGYALETDGVFGNRTLRCVKEFQAAKKLAADGIVGEKTWNMLV